MAIGFRTGLIRVLNLTSLNQTIMQYNAHVAGIRDIKMLNPAYLASVSDDFTFRVWNYTTGQLITTFILNYGEYKSPFSINFLQDGRFLLLCSDGIVIKIKILIFNENLFKYLFNFKI